jgi:hypothetical protein
VQTRYITDVALSLDIPSDLETRLRQEAARLGVDPAEYATRVLAHHLGTSTRTGPGSLSDLFAGWYAKDGTSDPAEIARRNQEFERFKESMNHNRADADGPGARRPYP